MNKQNEKKCCGMIIFCLVFLFNPTINLIDIMPDFIAWFLLAKIFERAADSAAYFEEARVSFLRLGWINLAKIPAFFLVAYLRSKNPMDSDILALASLVFATLEIIFIIPAVKNIFDAVFHVGERSDAKALITPINANRDPAHPLTPESVRGLTLLFLITKSILSTFPDFFLLTSETDSGYIVTVSRYYPIVLIISILFGLLLGALWLSKCIKYIKRIHAEGLFFDALESIATESSKEKFEAKIKIRKIKFSLTLLAISSFMSLELIFDNFHGINILPRFIYGIFMITSILFVGKHAKQRTMPMISAILYTLFAAAAFFANVSFLSKYEYLDLTANKAAADAYFLVELFGTLELIALVAMMIMIARYLLTDFIRTNTGTSPNSERYRRTEKEYHRSLIKKAYILSSFGILGGIARFVNIFLNREVQLIFSDITDMTRPSFSASALPWFNLVVTATAIIYIGYSLYYTSVLKEEVDMKYTFE